MTRTQLADARRVKNFVATKARRLIGGASQRRSADLATLAHLRRASSPDALADPTVWAAVDGLEQLEAPDRVTRGERAALAALNLLAVHQQSQSASMHTPGVGLGSAVRQLAATRSDDASLRRRFAAAVDADDAFELTVHLRSIVQQLRAESIGLDYGQLAADLMSFDYADGRTRVRQAWGRQLYRLGPTAPEPPTSTQSQGEQA